ncbi:MAG: TetR/AcrR family transcriptional regulator [Candidatus Melainabacteria bacterium]|nr:TetR/AcrR family transcriptional regulator [Candidatus Melainabacteria bacterium]
MKAKSESAEKTRHNLLDAATNVIRTKGYTATTVDDLCSYAGVTKGGFFHHFKSKEDLAIQATDYFAKMAQGIFTGAEYNELQDPLDRLLGYIDLRKNILQGEIYEYTCLLGTLVQETYNTSPSIRAACRKHMDEHIDEITKLVIDAKEAHCPDASFSAKSVAAFTQSVLQGSFILAKAQDSPLVASESVEHLKKYINSLFIK